MKIIYPFSPYKPATWNNWSNYLFWSSNSIDSIQDYLDYFNPNFYILNETLSYILINDKEVHKFTTDEFEELKKALNTRTPSIFLHTGEFKMKTRYFKS